ncbi:hypothetical protein [Micromonospora craniellae]|nr:hypothetical protein [Micromonospora craniellae]
MHALQVLPVLALLLGRFRSGRLDQRTQVRLLVVAGAAYGGGTVLLTWQALLQPDALTLVAVAALLVATVVATGVVIGRRRRTGPAEPVEVSAEGGPDRADTERVEAAV